MSTSTAPPARTASRASPRLDALQALARRRQQIVDRHAPAHGSRPRARAHAQRRASTSQSTTPAARWPTGPVTQPGGEAAGEGHGHQAIVARRMAVKTTTTELPESRVRVEAEVPPEEVERRVQQTARKLGSQLQDPRLSQGQGPPAGRREPDRPRGRARRGRPRVAGHLVRRRDRRRRHRSRRRPTLDLGDLPGEGEPLTFSIEIGVRPKATLGDYKGLEVGAASPT